MIRRALLSSAQFSCAHQFPSTLSWPTRAKRLPINHSPPVYIHRSYVTKSTADEKIEDLQELYATAKDEFEIASEETEKKTVYAADDRAAAHDELAKFKAAFEEAIKGEGGEEIKNRIGQRVRELENAVKAMDEMSKED